MFSLCILRPDRVMRIRETFWPNTVVARGGVVCYTGGSSLSSLHGSYLSVGLCDLKALQGTIIRCSVGSLGLVACRGSWGIWQLTAYYFSSNIPRDR
ncbi:hypothetical protein PAXRUDRAFT_831232 [Paxillus rubicundulus Ve08.2h10]|uniref:Uncharacterized protein n=1 Tax=Paxillus rubicundulus Ve08.2h10 TaxID=930991 RepID=A0A0D0DSC4_9AGAM|nr:hypothetical protein PAXRUDRAFT_831232 [Paxillus rubicundulus Ve08.2h10]